MRGARYQSGYGTALPAGSCSSLSYLGPLFPLPSRDRAVGDSPDGPHPAPMAEPDRELGALVGGWEARAAPGPGFELQAPGPEGSRLGGARDRICLKGVGFGGLLLSGRYC